MMLVEFLAVVVQRLFLVLLVVILLLVADFLVRHNSEQPLPSEAALQAPEAVSLAAAALPAVSTCSPLAVDVGQPSLFSAEVSLRF